MTLVILPDGTYGWFGSWDLAGLFVLLMTGEADS